MKNTYYVKAVTREGFLNFCCYQVAGSEAEAIEIAKMYATGTKGCRWEAQLAGDGPALVRLSEKENAK